MDIPKSMYCNGVSVVKELICPYQKTAYADKSSVDKKQKTGQLWLGLNNALAVGVGHLCTSWSLTWKFTGCCWDIARWATASGEKKCMWGGLNQKELTPVMVKVNNNNWARGFQVRLHGVHGGPTLIARVLFNLGQSQSSTACFHQQASLFCIGIFFW